MKSPMNNYYVYVYIDPRNYEEFYYGKGKRSRKESHLSDQSDSLKVKRIADIKKDGEKPIIRVIARDLSERDALLVEKTLLWKLGKLTMNVSGGHFRDNFRPPNTFHIDLSGFDDYQNRLWYYNVGDGLTRKWEDYVKFGFISGGQGARFRDYMQGFNEGDVIAAYLKRHGYVGIGMIKQPAKMIRDVRIAGKPLLKLPLLSSGMGKNSDDPERSEYVALVKWDKWVTRNQAKRRSSPRLFTTPAVRASLDGQPETVRFIEEAFHANLGKILA